MNPFEEALGYAARYCSQAEHCKSEILEKISRYELTQEEQASLIRRLEVDNYLNESRYVKAFVKDKFRFSKWGRIKIRYALRQKGISGELAEEGFSILSEASYEEMLCDLLRQKKRTLKASSFYELRGKLLRFAAGRGFEIELAGKCLHNMGLEDE
jgi:regulatory protein